MSTTTAPTLPTRQITSLIAVRTASREEHYDVLTRFFQMGWRYCYSSTVDDICVDWSEWPYIVVESPSRIANHTLNRYSSSHRELGSTLPVLSAFEFLATYGPAAPQPSISATNGTGTAGPVNPTNFLVTVNKNLTLSRIVQELAFKAGLKWIGDNEPKLFTWADITTIMVLRDSNRDGKANTLYTGSGTAGYPTYDAATQMGEIIRLLETPVVPPLVKPTIHGYEAVYFAGQDTITFGCAQISVNLLECAKAVMEKEQPGNRGVVAITLSSGKVLNSPQIVTILDYIRAINERVTKKSAA